MSHSFSKTYFTRKFEQKGIKDWAYENYPISNINSFPELWKKQPNLVGLNVTIPYKQQVIPFLDELDEVAKITGAVNTIKKEKNRLVGYNTDVYGFEQSLLKLLNGKEVEKALILGMGGASLAVKYVLDKMSISYQFVSRNIQKSPLTYSTLTPSIIQDNRLIINTTPLGTYPNIETAPLLDYTALSPKHFLLDLVYNPPLTQFLSLGKKQGATIMNGRLMLEQQAEMAWEIWRNHAKTKDE